ncbi:MAG: heavy metal-responsive transcriptional regulator [Isosphaera sp.]|nr:heavy metal-responsive transcriptional regulator [Isosphaera sp.]
MTIGQLARQAGVGVETIRFYEREGLLAEPGRLPSGYRRYPPDAVERVRFIRRAQRLGFTLRESKELLDLRDDPDAGQVDARERAIDKLADIDARITELQGMRAELGLVAVCRGREPVADCPIIAATGDAAPHECPPKKAAESGRRA